MVLQNEQGVLSVGAASSRDSRFRGWKPLPQVDYLMAIWSFQLSKSVTSLFCENSRACRFSTF